MSLKIGHEAQAYVLVCAQGRTKAAAPSRNDHKNDADNAPSSAQSLIRVTPYFSKGPAVVSTTLVFFTTARSFSSAAASAQTRSATST